MKEAIKVQSVTIIIINGISESFQSVRWVMQKTEAILAAGGGRGRVGRGRGRQLSAGEQPGRGCVWPPRAVGSAPVAEEGSGEMDLGQEVRRCPSPRLGDAGRSVKVSAFQGQGEVSSPPQLILDIKAKCTLAVGIFLSGHILQGLPKTSAHSALHQQRLGSAIGQAPGQPRVQTGGDTVSLCKELRSWRGKHAWTELWCKKL